MKIVVAAVVGQPFCVVSSRESIRLEDRTKTKKEIYHSGNFLFNWYNNQNLRLKEAKMLCLYQHIIHVREKILCTISGRYARLTQHESTTSMATMLQTVSGKLQIVMKKMVPYL